VANLGSRATPTVMTNDYGQNADYRNTEIVPAQQKHSTFTAGA